MQLSLDLNSVKVKYDMIRQDKANAVTCTIVCEQFYTFLYGSMTTVDNVRNKDRQS